MSNNAVAELDIDQDSSLKFRSQEIPGLENAILIYLSGYIETYNCSYFNRQMEKVLAAGFNKIVLQMAGITFISSTPVGAFVGLQKRLKDMHGSLVFVEMPPRPFEVFDLLGFKFFFDFVSSIPDALEILQRRTRKEQAFPAVFRCPSCGKRLRASKAGRFRCSNCKSIFVLDEEARFLPAS